MYSVNSQSNFLHLQNNEHFSFFHFSLLIRLLVSIQPKNNTFYNYILNVKNLYRFAANGQEKILNFENIFNDFERISIELLYRINPGHCYTIITDPLFQQALTGNVFHEMEKIGYFVINVQFNEDMSIPRNKTLESMAKARNAGCRCYLMFLANGIQMEHFLRLIDRERAISVEANMILLYDYRLFMPHMFYIWKRFVNVIFIRQSEQMVKGRKEKVFELATVPFPLPITKIFVTRNIDFWQNGRFRRGAKLIKNKNRNMYGQPLNAVVLKHTPGVSVGKNASSNNTYNGVEIEVIHILNTCFDFVIKSILIKKFIVDFENCSFCNKFHNRIF